MQLQVLSGHKKTMQKNVSNTDLERVLISIDANLLKNEASLQGLGNTNEIALLNMVNNGHTANETLIALGAAPNGKMKAKAKAVVNKAKETVKNVKENISSVAAKVVLQLLAKSPITFLYLLVDKPNGFTPKQVAKRAKAEKLFNALAKVFPVAYLIKHVRAEFIKTYKSTPEDYLRKLKANKGRSLNGLGSVILIATIMEGLAKILPSIVGMFKKEDVPSPDDFDEMEIEIEKAQKSQQPLDTPIEDFDKEADKEADKKKTEDTIKYVAIGGVVLTVIGGVIYYINKNSKPTTKRRK